MATVAKAESKKISVLVIELCDRRKSGFVLDGSAEEGMPEHLDSPGLLAIRETSQVKVLDPKKPGGYWLRDIRYIKGCSTIYVDEQEKMKVKPNRIVDRQDLFIENGSKYVTNMPASAVLFEYLKNYSGNIDNPLRPDTAPRLFREIKTERKAETSILEMQNEVAAKSYLLQLVISDKGAIVSYKEKEIDFLCELLKMPAQESFAEKLDALMAVALNDPSMFLNTVANAKAAVISEVNLALKLGVIKKDTSRAWFTQGDMQIITFKENTESAQIEELATMLLNPDKQTVYNQLVLRLTAAKNAALEVKNN